MIRKLSAVLIAATILAAGAVALSAQGNRPTIGIPAASEVLASCCGSSHHTPGWPAGGN